MAWLRKSDNTTTTDGILRAYDFEDIQMILENEREFMYPEDFHGKMTSEEKLKHRKKLLLKVAQKEMMDSLRCAMEMLEEYAEDLIKITAPKEKVIDGEVKTLQGWRDNGTNALHEYINVGDKVAVDIINHFIELLPPRMDNAGFFQIGEPYDSAKEGNRYATFIYLYRDKNYGEVWQYKGNCLAGSCEKGTEIAKVEN